MKRRLLDLETKKLLNKFGAGNHKPGSGSAAAFSGLLAANLIFTVISLTIEEKRRKLYGNWFEQLHEYKNRINSYIIPKLEKVFEEDSVQFGKVITLRENRNKETNLVKKSSIENQHLEQMCTATELPVEIGELCTEIGVISNFVFRNGFQAARGDSFVALSSSIGAITGCLSIIELNLLSFKPNDWTRKVRGKCNSLRDSYLNLLDLSNECSDLLKNEVEQKAICDQQIESVIKKVKGKQKISNKEIEEVAIKLQRVVWMNKDRLWKHNCPEDPIDILEPKKFLEKVLGYQCHKFHSISESHEIYDQDDIAGIIDQKNRVVYFSDQYSPEIQNFTLAHELGHAVFHNQSVMHRDLPLDGSSKREQRDFKEYQADKFASYFLMPSKQVRELFQEIFQAPKFVINENNSFKLMQLSPSNLKKELWNLRGLSRKIASMNSFGPAKFNSLSSIFGVSVEAMAIRLEELDLIEY